VTDDNAVNLTFWKHFAKIVWLGVKDDPLAIALVVCLQGFTMFGAYVPSVLPSSLPSCTFLCSFLTSFLP
jgi:hypothetical protein